jgi:hypothetical protein
MTMHKPAGEAAEQFGRHKWRMMSFRSVALDASTMTYILTLNSDRTILVYSREHNRFPVLHFDLFSPPGPLKKGVSYFVVVHCRDFREVPGTCRSVKMQSLNMLRALVPTLRHLRHNLSALRTQICFQSKEQSRRLIEIYEEVGGKVVKSVKRSWSWSATA